MPGANYLKNHLGMKLSEEQMKDIPSPRAELITHVAIKDVQAFTLLGSLVIGPIAAVARRHTRSLSHVVRLSRKSGLVGAALGAPAGAAMALGRMRTLNDDEVYDRCYRLRCNRNQVRVDQASVVGAVVGAAAGSFLGSPSYGAVLGVSGGLITAAQYNRYHNDKHT